MQTYNKRPNPLCMSPPQPDLKENRHEPIGGPSYLAGEAYRSGNMLLFWVAIALLVPAVGALGYFSVPRWGGKLLERLVQRLYTKEGSVSFLPPSGRAKVLGHMLAVFLGTCVVASVTLGSAFEIPPKYMQPISALYVDVQKSFNGKIPHTDYQITDGGRKALSEYWVALDQIRASSCDDEESLSGLFQ